MPVAQAVYSTTLGPWGGRSRERLVPEGEKTFGVEELTALQGTPQATAEGDMSRVVLNAVPAPLAAAILELLEQEKTKEQVAWSARTCSSTLRQK